MNKNQIIVVQLESSPGVPLRLGNVSVVIHLFTNGNYRYCFVVGRTDEKGTLSISFFDLERHRMRQAEYALMDFNTPIENCDRVAKVLILSEAELRAGAQKALKSYGKLPDWAADWPSNGRVEAQPQLVDLVAATTIVPIGCRILA